VLEQQLAKENLILKTITGSFLYGTEHEGSDKDYLGIFVPPKEYLYGLKKCEQIILNEKDVEETVDYTCYNLQKYIHLAMQNNPNIISVLYTPKDRIVFKDEYGQALIDNRHLFLSKKAYHSFSGYAHAQRKKIMNKDNVIGRRLDLIKKYGYDTKFAMHLLRLFYECLDIMVCGEIVYPSPHRQKLKSVRNGEYDLNWVLTEAHNLEQLVTEAYTKSNLQYKADEKAIEELQIKLFESYWKKQK
jgi:predicted nucleotidyltransferase